MSVSAISSNLATYQNSPLQNKLQQFQQEFQQLGEDLQSGDVSAAQGDVATLQQLGAAGSSSSNNPISAALSQVSEQLQAGNLSGAQQDYSNMSQNLQRPAHLHHHHHGASGTPSTPVENELSQLGQSIQAASQTSAQQAYALQVGLPLSTAASDPSLFSPSPSGEGISLTA